MRIGLGSSQRVRGVRLGLGQAYPTPTRVSDANAECSPLEGALAAGILHSSHLAALAEVLGRVGSVNGGFR